jgi:hypothetical protein
LLNDTTLLLGLDGVSVVRVERLADRTHRVRLATAARITVRLRGAAGRRIRDAASTVIQAARDLHLSWPTVMDAFRAIAPEVTEAPLPEVKVLGIDETRRGRPRRGNRTPPRTSGG